MPEGMKATRPSQARNDVYYTIQRDFVRLSYGSDANRIRLCAFDENNVIYDTVLSDPAEGEAFVTILLWGYKFIKLCFAE